MVTDVSLPMTVFGLVTRARLTVDAAMGFLVGLRVFFFFPLKQCAPSGVGMCGSVLASMLRRAAVGSRVCFGMRGTLQKTTNFVQSRRSGTSSSLLGPSQRPSADLLTLPLHPCDAGVQERFSMDDASGGSDMS